MMREGNAKFSNLAGRKGDNMFYSKRECISLYVKVNGKEIGLKGFKYESKESEFKNRLFELGIIPTKKQFEKAQIIFNGEEICKEKDRYLEDIGLKHESSIEITFPETTIQEKV